MVTIVICAAAVAAVGVSGWRYSKRIDGLLSDR